MIPQPSYVAMHASDQARHVCDADFFHQFNANAPTRCTVRKFVLIHNGETSERTCEARVRPVVIDTKAHRDACLTETRIAKQLRVMA